MSTLLHPPASRRNAPSSRAPASRRPASAHGRGFWAVGFAFAVALAYSAAPTPLYGLYAARDGFGSLTITVVFAAYAVGVVLSLFTVGHLSDWHGRRRVLVPALVVGATSTVGFLVWRDLTGLLVARFVSGLSVGAITATATAWLAELHAEDRPGSPPRRAEVVAIAANLGGIGLGGVIAGVLAQWVSHPLTVPFVVFGALQVVGIVGVALSPETRSVSTEERPAYRPQRVHVPRADRAPFFGALAAAFIAFAAFALFTSLGPSFLAGALHHPSHALAGSTAGELFFGAVLAQVVLGRRPNRELVLAGTACVVTGALAVVGAVWLSTPSLAMFLAGGAVLGFGAGALFKGALSTMVAISAPERRAETLAGLFLAAYLGLIAPAIGLGVLVQEVQAKVALLGFGGLLVVGVLASVGPMLRSARR